MDEETTIETTGSLSRKTGVCPATIRLYAKMGLIECTRSSDGRRLFAPESVAKVQSIYSERIKGRGYVRAAS